MTRLADHLIQTQVNFVVPITGTQLIALMERVVCDALTEKRSIVKRQGYSDGPVFILGREEKGSVSRGIRIDPVEIGARRAGRLVYPGSTYKSVVVYSYNWDQDADNPWGGFDQHFVDRCKDAVRSFGELLLLKYQGSLVTNL